MDVQQTANLRIYEEFGKRKIEFAYPAQTFYQTSCEEPVVPVQAPPSGGVTVFRSANVHLRSGGATRVVTITMMTTAE